MAGIASDDRQISFSNRSLRLINGLRYTRQPSCIICRLVSLIASSEAKVGTRVACPTR